MNTYKGYDGTIELDDDHLVIRREGRMAKLAGLGATREIPLAAISSVTFKPATHLVNGYLQLRLGADPPRKQVGDPNSVIFTHRHAAEFAELAEFLQQRIVESQAAGIDPATMDVDHGASRFDRLAEKADRLEEQVQAERLAMASLLEQSFAGVTLRDGRIDSPQGGGPIGGAHATVDAAGAIERRTTATRWILAGPMLAHAWQ
jgi:hypothetical protein